MNSQLKIIGTGMFTPPIETVEQLEVQSSVQNQQLGLIESARNVVGRVVSTVEDTFYTPSRKLAAGLAAAAMGGGILAAGAEAKPVQNQQATIASASADRTLKTSETLLPFPHMNSAQAIYYLNKQRVANGMLPVTENSQFDSSCQGTVNAGFNKNISNKATAASVDWISGSAGGGNLGEWSNTTNPWSDTPIVQDTIFDPIMTQTGYAETSMKWGLGQGCIETYGNRQWSSPTFYSLPGNNASIVPWETATPTQSGATPGSVVGIPVGTKTGPNIELWPEGITGTKVNKAALTGPDGLAAVKIVNPGDPYPKSIGGTVDTHASFAIPSKPLKPNSNYVLDAQWVDDSGNTYPQVVDFKTASAQAADHTYTCTGCPHGHFDFKIKGDKMRVELSPAANQKISVAMMLERKECVISKTPCPPAYSLYFYDKVIVDTIRRYRRPVTISLPHRTPLDSTLRVTVTTGRFTAEGYQWGTSNSLGTTMPAPK